MYVSDRRNHDVNVIKPELDAGKLVLGDRSYPTTVAYCPPEWRKFVLATNQQIVTRPDLMILKKKEQMRWE